jgi:hypothetical protein
MKFKVTREFYISKDAEEIKDDESGAVVYIIVRDNGVSMMGFGGRRQRPDFHYSFETREIALNYAESYFEGEREKVRKKKEKKEFRTTLKVGDILSSSWGYDQTNVDFYQVVEVKKSGKSVVIQKISSRLVLGEGCAPMSGTVMPNRDGFAGEPMLKRVQFWRKSETEIDEYLTMASYASASKWDGKPEYCSWYH